LKGATSRPEVDAALNELEERVVMLRGILEKEVAEERRLSDSVDDVSAETDGSEMQETAVEATKEPTREEAVAEAANKTKGKPQ
jgi:hypothetical protein